MDLEDLNEEDTVLWERLQKTETETQALTRHLAEMRHLQAQILSKLRAYYHVNAMSIPCQDTTISANVTITISNDTIIESVLQPTRNLEVDPISLNTTALGIANTIPIYHADDNGLLEVNRCTNDTKDELIRTLPSTSSMEGESVPSSTPNSCSATYCGLRSLFSKALMEAEEAPTPNLFQNHLSTTPMDSVCDSHFPGTKSLLSTSKLLPDFLKESIKLRCAKRGVKNFIPSDPSIFA